MSAGVSLPFATLQVCNSPLLAHPLGSAASIVAAKTNLIKD